MQTTSGTPASAASKIASGGEAGRHEDHGGIGPGGLHSQFDGIEYWDFAVQDPLAAFAGGDARDHIGAIGDHLLGVKNAFIAGDALHQQACIFIDQDAHY